MSYNYQTYLATSTGYDPFAPGKTTTTATNSSVNANAQQVTLTFASAPTVNPNDLVYITNGTFTGNSWNGFRYVVSANATTVTFAMPNTPGTYVSGTVQLLTGYAEFGQANMPSNILFSTNVSVFVCPISGYANTTFTGPANDQASFLVQAGVTTLPIKGPVILATKTSTIGGIMSVVETK